MRYFIAKHRFYIFFSSLEAHSLQRIGRREAHRRIASDDKILVLELRLAASEISHRKRFGQCLEENDTNIFNMLRIRPVPPITTSRLRPHDWPLD